MSSLQATLISFPRQYGFLPACARAIHLYLSALFGSQSSAFQAQSPAKMSGLSPTFGSEAFSNNRFMLQLIFPEGF